MSDGRDDDFAPAEPLNTLDAIMTIADTAGAAAAAALEAARAAVLVAVALNKSLDAEALPAPTVH